MKENIKVTKENINFFKTLISDEIEIGDTIVKSKTGLEVKLTSVRIAPNSNLDPQMIVEMHEEFEDTFKDLVDR